MADVRNHPQPVHFRQHVKTKWRQPIMLWRIGRAVGPIGRQAVRDGHIACAERIALPQDLKRVADGMPAFHANHRRDLACLHRALHLSGGRCISKGLWIARDHLPHDVNLRDGACHRLMLWQRGIDIYRPKLTAEETGARGADIGMRFGKNIGRQCREVEFREIPVEHFRNLVRRIIMSVDDGGFCQHLTRGFFGGRGVHRRERGQGKKRE